MRRLVAEATSRRIHPAQAREIPGRREARGPALEERAVRVLVAGAQPSRLRHENRPRTVCPRDGGRRAQVTLVNGDGLGRDVVALRPALPFIRGRISLRGLLSVSYTHLTLPTLYSV